MNVTLYTSSFCGACTAARGVLDRAVELVTASAAASVTLTEINVATDPEAAENAHITSTPTITVGTEQGEQVFRAEGVPSLPQALQALALAIAD